MAIWNKNNKIGGQLKVGNAISGEETLTFASLTKKVTMPQRKLLGIVSHFIKLYYLPMIL